ncbi:MAG: hypothetical protein IPG80_08775 [Anaerolineales bacterium]|nr:hypothetical protein [Anaerolineales bacterium]
MPKTTELVVRVGMMVLALHAGNIHRVVVHQMHSVEVEKHVVEGHA